MVEWTCVYIYLYRSLALKARRGGPERENDYLMYL